MATSVSTNVVTPAANSVPSLFDYAERIAKKIWPKDHTRNSNLRGIRWFADYNGYGKQSLADIRKGQVYEFIDYLIEDRGIKESTANRYQAGISRVIREANEREIVDNPIKLKYAKEDGGRPRWFTKDEEAELISYFRDIGKDWMADMAIMAINTGMRKGEIRAITHRLALVSDDGQWLFLPKEVIKQNEDRHIPLNRAAHAAYLRLTSVVEGKNTLLIEEYSHRSH